MNSSEHTAAGACDDPARSESIETGFSAMSCADQTVNAVEQATPTVNTVADTGEDPDVDLDARIAGLLSNKSATNWNTVSAFMASVVAWPGDQTPGFVNLHYSYPDRQDPKVLVKKGGRPFTALDKFVSYVGWALTTTNHKDMWYCTSLQEASGVNKHNKPKAIRLAANAALMKAIWVDIDVDEDPKHYHTVEEALRAILTFQTTVRLPAPSAIVYSGSGLHVYWISKDPLTPREWMPYAAGLKGLLLANNIKCDAGLTTDCARILRVPGTLNYKYTPRSR